MYGGYTAAIRCDGYTAVIRRVLRRVLRRVYGGYTREYNRYSAGIQRVYGGYTGIKPRVDSLPKSGPGPLFLAVPRCHPLCPGSNTAAPKIRSRPVVPRCPALFPASYSLQLCPLLVLSSSTAAIKVRSWPVVPRCPPLSPVTLLLICVLFSNALKRSCLYKS